MSGVLFRITQVLVRLLLVPVYIVWIFAVIPLMVSAPFYWVLTGNYWGPGSDSYVDRWICYNIWEWAL